MTLVLTKVTRDGIAMAADAAITESYGRYDRILIGAAKLLPHPASSSCFGTWGEAVIPNPRPNHYPISLEFLLRQYIDIAKSITDGDALSAKLVEWLNDNFPIAKGIVGIEVASARGRRRSRQPAVYRLMNANAIEDKPGKFRRFVIRPVGPHDEQEDASILVAGDINARTWVDEIRAAIRNATFRTGTQLPTTAAQTAPWLAVIVRSVSDHYHNLQIGRTIGGPVKTIVLRSGDGKIVQSTML